MPQINIGFFPAHPAQFLMMKALAEHAPKSACIKWFIRDKDITKQLADAADIEYELVSKAQTGILGNATELISNIFKFNRLTKKNNIHIWFSKYGAVNIASRLNAVPNYSFNDDDEDIVPLIAYTSYPFANKVFCTNWTRSKRFADKVIHYPSFHELFYLHPNRFQPKSIEEIGLADLSSLPIALIRLSSLQAHHDVNVSGIDNKILDQLINMLAPTHRILISSEGELPQKYQHLRFNISITDIHHVLFHAALLISDSQTMTAEAAVMGTPNLRVSSFKGKIGYLDALESFGLSHSVLPTDKNISEHVFKLIHTNKNNMKDKRTTMLTHTIDPVPFFWQQMLLGMDSP